MFILHIVHMHILYVFCFGSVPMALCRDLSYHVWCLHVPSLWCVLSPMLGIWKAGERQSATSATDIIKRFFQALLKLTWTASSPTHQLLNSESHMVSTNEATLFLRRCFLSQLREHCWPRPQLKGLHVKRTKGKDHATTGSANATWNKLFKHTNFLWLPSVKVLKRSQYVFMCRCVSVLIYRPT